ncbi:MAG: CopG family transcriptional regulator [Cyclobacteriaceae bacterium]
MTRQSISLTEPNELWLKAMIDSQEYTSKSEIVNDLIRRAREKEQEKIDFIRAKLVRAENSGFTHLSQKEILAQSKEGLK